ncbi:MAG: energy-coupling factor transporter transmembrane protein EcfT, partial [Desulfobulbaceae bacterium]|nr:energy-coupling factor transporter transmembrane protein EcfT [Desulfobulbaceae bacterium]
MLAEPFAHGNSLMHQLDPRGKVVAAVLFSCVAAVSFRWDSLGLALLTAMFLVVLAKPSPGRIMRRLLLANLFVACVWLFLPFSHSGTGLLHLGPFTATL